MGRPRALPSIRTQVVWGARDPYCPVHLASDLNAPVVTVPNAGHWALVEAPGTLAAAIEAVSR